MNAATSVLEISPQPTLGARLGSAQADLRETVRLWRLWMALGWFDIRLRYRGSVLGPLWVTLSTAVMVGGLGFLYSALFVTNLHDYLPFLALSLVLWGYLSTMVSDACTCFLQSESMIRSLRLPFCLHAGRAILRNMLVLLHSVIVILVVFVVFDTWPGWVGLLTLPSLLLWAIDSLAVCLLLGAFCARFRDIPPIVASVMQIAFFLSPVMWKPEMVGRHAQWLPLNPFFSLLEIVRGPLLGQMPSLIVWVSAFGYSLVLCLAAWLLFARVRSRLAFWV
jgi:lipopolysaccharide transport system permease protein